MGRIMNVISLGPLEQAVMAIIWRDGNVPVRHVWHELQKDRPIAYTTVMTLMHRLTEKGFLQQEKKGKTHFFSALHSQHQTLHNLVKKTLAAFVDRFGEEAIAAFAEETEQQHQPSSRKKSA